MKLSKVYQMKIRRSFAAILSSAIVLTSFSVPVFAEEVQEEAVLEEVALGNGLVGDEAAETVSGDKTPATESGNLIENKDTDKVDDKVEDKVPGNVEDVIDTSKDAENLEKIGTPTFDSTYKSCSAEYQKNGNVKIKWRVNGGKYAKIYTVVSPQNGLGIIEKKKNNYDEYIKGRSFVDENPDKDGSVYIVCVYDRGNSLLQTFITVPSTYVMSARSQEKDVMVTIAGLKSGCEYSISKATGKSGNPYNVVRPEAFKPSELKATKYADRLAYIYVDKDNTTIATSDYNTNKKNKSYYKVQAIVRDINVAGFKGDIASKESKYTSCVGQRYAAPIVSFLEGTKEHSNGCKSEVTIWFAKPKEDYNHAYEKMTNSKATFEVYRTVNGKALTLIETVKGSGLKENQNGTLYGISFTGAPAEEKYSYLIRYVQDSKYSEYSNAVDYSFHFQDVTHMTAANAGAKKVRLRWNTEQCATKYNIYRTVNTFNTQAEALAAVQVMKRELGNKNTKANGRTLKNLGKASNLNGMKLSKAVTNELATGDEMETDIGGLQAGVYYGFMIVPTDTKFGYDDAGCIASYVKIGAPGSFKYDTKGTAGFKLSWGSVPRATGYRLERVTVSSQNGTEDLTGLEDWKSLGTNYCYKDYGTTTRKIMVNKGSDKENVEVAVPGEIYLYRILTLTSDGVSEPARERFQVCVLGPKAPTNVTATMLRKGTTSSKSDSASLYWESKESKKYFTVSGNKVLKRGLRISFTAADKKNTAKYDIYKSTNGGDTYELLGSMVPGSENKGNTYKQSSSKINVYDSDLRRGVSYVYKIVPVGTDGTEGLAAYADFCVASSWKIYSKNNSGYNTDTCADKKVAMPVKAGETYRFYVNFKEYDTTVTDITVNDNSEFKIAGKGVEEYYSYGIKRKRTYIDIEVAKNVSEGDAKKLTFKYAGRFDDSATSGKPAVPELVFVLKVK